MKLPDLTQEPIRHIDGTPDRYYPLRILRAHRANCDIKWSSGTDPEDPLMAAMNEACDARARILDRAIDILEHDMTYELV